MRGTPIEEQHSLYVPGIIPAHAGNTTSAGTARVSVKGSSPRMRGTRDRVPASPGVVGIIPAHAGNTRSTGSEAYP